MLKKLSLFWIGVSLFSLTSVYSSDILVEGRAAYYYFTDSTTRDIYGNTGLYSLETNFSSCGNIYSWASAGYLYASGNTKLENTSTKLTYVPLALGLKYMCCFNCFRPYIGGGLLVSYLHTTDDSPFVVKVRNKWGVGGIFKSGVLWDFTQCFFLDVFLDYSWMKIDFKDTDKTSGRTADLSGLSVGAGIGYRF